MAKIYYSIDCSSIGYPVHWIDERGQAHVEKIALERLDYTSGDIDQKFLDAHPRAVYLQWDKFTTRLALVEAEKAKLAWWNARTAL